MTRIGSQRPRLSHIPPDIDNTDAGDEVIEFAKRFGLVLDDWQQWVVQHMCAERADGSWAATQSVLLVPRQSGKSAILEVLEMAALFLWDEQHVIYSAHLGKTASDHMRRIRRHIDAVPDFKRRARVLTGKGDERVERTDTGAILEFITRGKKTSRGGSPNRVVFDEAMFLKDDQVQAMVPALSAQSMNEDAAASMVYASSAPIAESQVLHRLRDRALTQSPRRMFFAEWSVDADADYADVDNWYQANPGMGIRISEEWVKDNEFGTMSPEAFAVERLGIPEALGMDAGPIDLARWEALTDGDSLPLDETVRLALDVPPARTSATFCIAGKRSDNLLHVSHRHHVPPHEMRDLVSLAKGLTEYHGTALILPPNSPAKAWRSELLEAGVPLDELTPAEYAEACGAMQSAVLDGRLRHRGHPDLDAAVAGLAVKSSGDVDVWSRRSSSSNIAPMVAATCALVRVAEVKAKPAAAAFAVFV